MDVSARYNKQHIENQPSAGYLNNPITGAYLFPRGEDWDYYKSNYEVYDGVRNVNVHNWTNTKTRAILQPYWMLNRQTPITDVTVMNLVVVLNMISWKVFLLRGGCVMNVVMKNGS